MKLISLNLWGGRIYQPLVKFLKEHRDVDIFCFQEVYNNAEKISDEFKARPNLLAELRELLPEHTAFFRPSIKDVYGIGIFVKKEIPVSEEGEFYIYENPNYSGHSGNHSRNLQWIKFKANGKDYSIMNVHGLWTGKGKTDTPERIEQSRKIKEIVSSFDGSKVLCGDFNLLPDTESIKMLEEDMINLIKKHDIKSTRSYHYTKPEKFADYIFVSPNVKVKKFEVLQEPVSDHLPLMLEFE